MNMNGSSCVFKFNIEQPSIVLNPCLHLPFVSERKFNSVIAYTVLTINVLVCVVYLFGNMENTITICRYCGEFLFLCLRLCQPDGMFCHALGINEGNFGLLGLQCHASLLQGTANFEPRMILFYSFVHLFIQPPEFWVPLVVLGETANFGGSIQQRTLKLWPSWLNAFAVSASAPEVVVTTDVAIMIFALKADWNKLAVAGSLSFQIRMRGEKLRFFTWGKRAEKSHTAMQCCLTQTLLGIIFTLMTALQKLLR